MSDLDILIKSIVQQLKESETKMEDLRKAIDLLRDLGENTAQKTIEYQQLIARREQWKNALRARGYSV
jgi:hypothetical protein